MLSTAIVIGTWRVNPGLSKFLLLTVFKKQKVMKMIKGKS